MPAGVVVNGPYSLPPSSRFSSSYFDDKDVSQLSALANFRKIWPPLIPVLVKTSAD